MSSYRNAIFLLLIFLSAVVANNRRREEQQATEELDKLQLQIRFQREELENIRVHRWQDKRNAVAGKEAFRESWDEVRRDVDRLGAQLGQKEESRLRLESQLKNRHEKVHAQHERIRQLGILLEEKSIELQMEIEAGLPLGTRPLLSRLGALQKSLEESGHYLSLRHLDRLFDLHEDWLHFGESRTIERVKQPVEGIALLTEGSAERRAALKNPAAAMKTVAGVRIRLGAAYGAFVSSESEDVAILAKTGRLGSEAWVWLEDLPAQNRSSLKAFVSALLRGEENASPLFLPVDMKLEKSTGTGFRKQRKSAWFEALLLEWKGAGWVIYPLAFCVLLAFLITLVKGLQFVGSGRLQKEKLERGLDLLESGERKSALELFSGSRAALSHLACLLLEKQPMLRTSCEEAAHVRLLQLLPSFEKGVNWLGILAAAAPLLGLLGTVQGMVNMFAAITSQGADPKVMAGGIGEALLSTKWGLITAIPILLLSNLLTNRAENIVNQLEYAASALINTIYGPKLSGHPEVAEELRKSVDVEEEDGADVDPEG